MLDNGSRDGSAQAARAHGEVDELIALEQRRGKALNDSQLLRHAHGRYALLLNEDSELQPGATRALWQALQDDPRAACAGAQLLAPDGAAQPCAWRFPTPLTALAGALFLHRAVHGAEQGRAHARGRLVPVLGAARASRGRRAGRLPGRRLLRLFRRGRLRATPARRRLAQPVRAGRARRAPRAAVHRPSPSGASSSCRAIATSTCESTTPRAPRGPCAG